MIYYCFIIFIIRSGNMKEQEKLKANVLKLYSGPKILNSLIHIFEGIFICKSNLSKFQNSVLDKSNIIIPQNPWYIRILGAKKTLHLNRNGSDYKVFSFELVGQNCNSVKSRILCLRFINITIIPLNTVLVNRFLKSFCKIIETLSYYFLYLMYKTLGSREENQSWAFRY